MSCPHVLAMWTVLALFCGLTPSVSAAGIVVTESPVYRSPNVSADGQTLLLGGLFPIHQAEDAQPPCGSLQPFYVQTVEAMAFAIQTINEDPTLLPSVTLAFDIRDTCQTVNYALQQSVDYIQFNTGMCSSAEALLGTTGIVGPFQSTISEATANLYGLFQLPQISYGSSAPLLSDQSRYRFFFRTIPSDLFQARALADLVRRFGWSYITVLHSDDLYGVGGMEAFMMELRRNNTDGRNCIARPIIQLEDTPQSYNQALDIMGREWISNASVVLLFGHLENAIGMLTALSDRLKRNPDFHLQNITWIGSDSWGDNLPDEYRPLARGMLSTVPQSDFVRQFDGYFTSLHPLNHTANPWFAEYWEDVFDCSLNLSSSPSSLPPCDVDNQIISLATSNYSQFSLVPLVIEAVYIFAKSIQNLINYKCPNETLCSQVMVNGAVNGSLLRDSLLNISLPDLGPIFDMNGDVAANYSVRNLQTRVSNQYTFEVVGSWDTVNGLKIEEEDIEWVTGTSVPPQSICAAECGLGGVRRSVSGQPPCCFTCLQCPNATITLSNQCMSCELGKTADSSQLNCMNNTKTFLTWSDPWAIALTTLTCMGMLVTVFVGVVFLVYINHEFIKASSRELSGILLLGILLCYIVPFFHIAKPTKAICGIRRFFLSFCFALSYSALLVKTNRIHRIFNRNPNSTVKQLRFISPLSQVLITLILVSGQILINIISLAVVPPDTKVILGEETNELTCAISPELSLALSIIYNFLLLVMSAYFAFLTRKVPANFNEAKFINANVYSILVIWLAFVPTYFATAGLGTIFQTASLVFGIILSAGCTLCCLFVSKVIILFSRIRKTKKMESQGTSHNNNLSVNNLSTIPGSVQSNNNTRSLSISAPATQNNSLMSINVNTTV